MLDYITSYLRSNTTPGQAGNIFWAFVYIVLIFLGLSIAVIAMNWLERKILAHMQVRLGPMRVGPHGLLQPLADALKLILKEDIVPAESDRPIFWFAPVLSTFTALAGFTVLPFSGRIFVANVNVGILVISATSAIGILGIVLGGWSSNRRHWWWHSPKLRHRSGRPGPGPFPCLLRSAPPRPRPSQSHRARRRRGGWR